MTWFNKPKYKNVKTSHEKVIPSGVWVKCPECENVSLKSDLDKNLKICGSCGYHFKLTTQERIDLLCDKESFIEHFSEITSGDPLKFSDAKGTYKEKLKTTIKKLGIREGVVSGEAKVSGKAVILAVMDFRFLGGSMGCAIGEKIYRSMKLAIEKKYPFISVASSGGARMHEGILSLMQMAKTCAGLVEMEEAALPHVSILTDPTTGGVTASFASIGDIVISEPGALIGFAGPRVIEQTIKQKLPKGFQRAEFLLDHGFVDLIVKRDELKPRVSEILSFFVK